jgi:hypothetical protein
MENRSSQAQVISEYAVTFFLIVAVISAMSIMVKRALQGRLYEARNTMIRIVNAETGPGLVVPLEYEPYYIETNSEVEQNSRDTVMLFGGAAPGVAGQNFLHKTEAHTNSVQFPPKDAK